MILPQIERAMPQRRRPYLLVALFLASLLCLLMSAKVKPPSIALPPKLRSNVPGTWAFDTMSRRIHTDILPRIVYVYSHITFALSLIYDTHYFDFSTKDNSALLAEPDAPSFAETFLQLNDLKSSLECGRSGFLRPLCDSGTEVSKNTYSFFILRVASYVT